MRVALMIMAIVAQTPGQEPASWLTSYSYETFHVVVAENASPCEKFAAQEFARLWKLTTAKEIAVSNAAVDGVNVWIGCQGAPPEVLRGLDGDLARLGDDGFRIRTSRRQTEASAAPTALLIAGGSKRGTLYGVYQFFEDYMGVRWLTPEVTHVPKPPERLPVIDIEHIPPFSFRDCNYRAFVQSPAFAAVHRLNGHATPVPPEMGGSIAFAGGFAGTVLEFVKPAEQFAKHPEYFSEVNGARSEKATQLCLSNPDVLKITTDQVRELLKANPDKRVVSVSPMDQAPACTCAQCRVLDEREGGPSGSLITLVNQIAEAVAKDYADAFIATVAADSIRKPPKTVKPRDNVIVCVSAMGCDAGRPLSDDATGSNGAFVADLKGWAKITKNLYVWDCIVNRDCFQAPYPNLDVLQPNAAFYAGAGIRGVFDEASATSSNSEFEYLRGYVAAHCLWNPRADAGALQTEFINLYYGEGAPFVSEYIKLIGEAVKGGNVALTCSDSMQWMDYDTVVAADAIFKRAIAAVKDEEALKRLKSAYLPVQYAALVCPPKFEAGSKAYVERRPPSLTLDEYYETLKGLGVTQLNEREPIDALRARLNNALRPRQAEAAIEVIENRYYVVWVVPKRGGAVVRWTDKQTGLELLKGYETARLANGVWQEWSVAEDASPAPEGPLAPEYTLVNRDMDGLTIEAKLANGLVVRRRMTLKANTQEFEIHIDVRNKSEAPLAPRVKFHAEFDTGGRGKPDILVTRDGKSAPAGAGVDLDAKGLSGCSFRVPGRMTLTSAFTPGEVAGLRFPYDPESGQMALELIPPLEPLAPGAARSIHMRYSLVGRELKNPLDALAPLVPIGR